MQGTAHVLQIGPGCHCGLGLVSFLLVFFVRGALHLVAVSEVGTTLKDIVTEAVLVAVQGEAAVGDFAGGLALHPSSEGLNGVAGTLLCNGIGCLRHDRSSSR
mmetsp:Transcript_63111/g.73856  ORF Transcript_63111/g.73856 Transcript_63111/m.73856 type:complete len:103 (-) Transcript_63111:1672-1980(-)